MLKTNAKKGVPCFYTTKTTPLPTMQAGKGIVWVWVRLVRLWRSGSKPQYHCV